MKLSIISLGCSKNLMDSELFLGMAKQYNIELTNDFNKSDIIVINTCGFITSSKEESIDTIIEMLDYQKEGKKILVMGCLVERYLDSLKEEIPEVDHFIPIKDYSTLNKFFSKLTGIQNNIDFYSANRILSTPKNTAYLRIGEGCSNNCAYCAIPLIRGPYKSRPYEEIMKEIEYLHKLGIQELTIIQQDTSKYGSDMNNMSLAKLLDNICNLNYFRWIRVLYMYPDEITDELIDVFAKHDSLLNYFDIPIQHASNKILKAMNRRGNQDLIKTLIQKIRNKIPNSIIRSTLIVGFPGETSKDFDILFDFVNDVKFDHLGVFTYSDEEGTKAFNYPHKVRSSTSEKRKEQIMLLQYDINFERLTKLIGSNVTAIVDHYDFEQKQYALRYFAQALDDADGYIYVEHNNLNIGDFVDVEIIDVLGYDLIGKIKEF